MSRGTIFLTAVNNADIEWKIDRYQIMGSLDCRSLGYFHISRHSLQRIMSDNANFLNDRQSVEYFNIPDVITFKGDSIVEVMPVREIFLFSESAYIFIKMLMICLHTGSDVCYDCLHLYD